jgi:hypothetical protein
LKMIIPVGITYTSALCHTVLGNYLTVPAVRTAGSIPGWVGEKSFCV